MYIITYKDERENVQIIDIISYHICLLLIDIIVCIDHRENLRIKSLIKLLIQITQNLFNILVIIYYIYSTDPRNVKSAGTGSSSDEFIVQGSKPSFDQRPKSQSYRPSVKPSGKRIQNKQKIRNYNWKDSSNS